MVQYLTHIALIHLFIITRDNDKPQCGLDNIEGVDVAYIEIVLLAEPCPTLPNPVPPIPPWEGKHLPGFHTAH